MNGSRAETTPVLRVTEIFRSLQGEADSVGWPTVFVRLTGCPLRCRYCDTAYAFEGGQKMGLNEILDEVRRWPVRHVTVTGGEPLAQKGCLPLLTSLCEAGYRVSLETGGALPLAGVDPRVIKVVDLKTPGSGEVKRNRYCNLEHMGPEDQIKFVICDRADYEWAKARMAEYEIPEICQVLMSPAWGELEARELAEWILADGLDARLQVQLHKFLWGEEPGR